jgi:polyhydroxyalkanoate synthesis repressor PhaR
MGRTKRNPPGDGPVIVKKYANRRLYNTETSSYITLENLAEMVRKNREFQVLDAKTGEDLTHTVLSQIILEGESGESPMLPSGFLRQIIALYGDSVQKMVPDYLEASMTAFKGQQDKVRGAVEQVIASNPFADMAKRNFELFEAATSAFRPRAAGTAKTNDKDTEIAALKAEITALKAELAGKK